MVDISGPCGRCVWENHFGDCVRVAYDLSCHYQEQVDCHTDCSVCPQRLVCTLSPSYLGVDAL